MKSLSDLVNPQKGYIVLSDCIHHFQLWLKEICAKYSCEDAQYILPYPESNIRTFQHLCFRIKNAVFSLTVSLYDSAQKDCSGNYETMDLQPLDVELNTTLSTKYNLIPGKVFLDIQNQEAPVVETYDGKAIDIIATCDTYPVSSMSWWELYVKGIDLVVTNLGKAGAKGLEYSYLPNYFPQIVCELRGEKIGIFINPNLASSRQTPTINRSMYKQLKSKGINPYVADLNFAPINSNGKPDLSAKSAQRGSDLMTNYMGELWRVKYLLWIKLYSRYKI